MHRILPVAAVLGVALSVVCGAAVGAKAATAASAPASAVFKADVPVVPAPAASAPQKHRPLRMNLPPPAAPEPTDPELFTGTPGAPPFSVQARKGQLALYPCSQCHKLLPLNTTPRKLVAAPHNATLRHGGGRFWCLDCHQGNDRDVLHSTGGVRIDFDQSWQLCGQCHSARQRDWAFGAHGKRVAGWGPQDREIYACTHCHDPHAPTVAPRAPSRPPPVRAGLQPMNTVHEPSRLPWQRDQEALHDRPPGKP